MRSSLSEFIADNRKELEVIGDNSGRLRDSFVSLAATFSSIFETMQKLSDRAEKSKQLLGSIARKIGAGNGSLESLDSAMDRINMNSAKMNEIISVINDISDRINLLSLNASIEAARAGDAGRGFAVVAEEISRLADATASSTRDIEALITHSAEATREGFKTVRETLSHIGSVSDEILQINDTFEGMYSFLEAQKEAKVSAERETELVVRISDEGNGRIVRHQEYVEQAQNAVQSLDRSLEENGRAAVEISSVTDRIQNMMRTMREKSDFFKV
jgi:methyl-accepting chemotaxis protein